jgi:hypothetical protein
MIVFLSQNLVIWRIFLVDRLTYRSFMSNVIILLFSFIWMLCSRIPMSWHKNYTTSKSMKSEGRQPQLSFVLRYYITLMKRVGKSNKKKSPSEII